VRLFTAQSTTGVSGEGIIRETGSSAGMSCGSEREQSRADGDTDGPGACRARTKPAQQALRFVKPRQARGVVQGRDAGSHTDHPPFLLPGCAAERRDMPDLDHLPAGGQDLLLCMRGRGRNRRCRHRRCRWKCRPASGITRSSRGAMADASEGDVCLQWPS